MDSEAILNWQCIYDESAKFYSLTVCDKKRGMPSDADDSEGSLLKSECIGCSGPVWIGLGEPPKDISPMSLKKTKPNKKTPPRHPCSTPECNGIYQKSKAKLCHSCSIKLNFKKARARKLEKPKPQQAARKKETPKKQPPHYITKPGEYSKGRTCKTCGVPIKNNARTNLCFSHYLEARKTGNVPQTSFVVDFINWPGLLEQVKKRADDETRSTNNQIIHVLRKYFPNGGPEKTTSDIKHDPFFKDAAKDILIQLGYKKKEAEHMIKDACAYDQQINTADGLINSIFKSPPENHNG